MDRRFKYWTRDLMRNIKWEWVFIALVTYAVLLAVYHYCTIGHKKNAVEGYAMPPPIVPLPDPVEDAIPPIDRVQDKYKGEIKLYYATWCGYSKSFLPIWAKFEEHAKSKMPFLRITRVKCESDNEAQCMQDGVEGYPTVILYPTDGTPVEFRSERTTERLIEFVNTNL